MIFETDKKHLAIAFDIAKITAAVEKAIQSQSYSEYYTEEEAENYHEYIRLMAELDWPAYINGDSAFHQLVLDRYESEGEEGVVSAIYDYYGALYLKDLEDQLAESVVIKKERLPLFHEAFLLYQLGYYYGAVAILINQIVGITADIENFLKSHNVSYDPKTVELMEKRYRVTSATDTGRVMTAVVEGKNIDDDEGEYGYLLGYLRFKVFNTHMPKDETQKHTNRHLLCHGAQLNYGTKEHALKVILCIDALMWVAEVIADNLGD